MIKYRYYLQYGPTFLWRTDNNALTYIRTMDCPSGIIERWLNTLADFDFDVEHRAGKKHGNADGLSRMKKEDGPDVPEADALLAPMEADDVSGQFGLQHDASELLVLQEADEDLREVHRWLHRKVPPDALEVKRLSRVGQKYAACLLYTSDAADE